MKESEKVLAQVREERHKLMQLQIKKAHLWEETQKVNKEVGKKKEYISNLVFLAEKLSKSELEEKENEQR